MYQKIKYSSVVNAQQQQQQQQQLQTSPLKTYSSTSPENFHPLLCQTSLPVEPAPLNSNTAALHPPMTHKHEPRNENHYADPFWMLHEYTGDMSEQREISARSLVPKSVQTQQQPSTNPWGKVIDQQDFSSQQAVTSRDQSPMLFTDPKGMNHGSPVLSQEDMPVEISNMNFTASLSPDYMDEKSGDSVMKRSHSRSVASKNLVSERKRRKKLNEGLYHLRALVPKISKVSCRSSCRSLDFLFLEW